MNEFIKQFERDTAHLNPDDKPGKPWAEGKPQPVTDELLKNVMGGKGK